MSLTTYPPKYKSYQKTTRIELALAALQVIAEGKNLLADYPHAKSLAANSTVKPGIKRYTDSKGNIVYELIRTPNRG